MRVFAGFFLVSFLRSVPLLIDSPSSGAALLGARSLEPILSPCPELIPRWLWRHGIGISCSPTCARRKEELGACKHMGRRGCLSESNQGDPLSGGRTHWCHSDTGRKSSPYYSTHPESARTASGLR